MTDVSCFLGTMTTAEPGAPKWRKNEGSLSDLRSWRSIRRTDLEPVGDQRLHKRKSTAMSADAQNMQTLEGTSEPAQTVTKSVMPKLVPALAVIHLIEDNAAVREAARALFEGAGLDICDHFSAEEFLAGPRPKGEACLLIDVMLPGMDGVTLLETLRREGVQVPAIMLTGRNDAATAVAALKAGAADFIEKPADPVMLLASVISALDRARDVRIREEARAQAKARFDKLTRRESEVLTMVVDGTPNKNIAADLGLSQRTVENHRASAMRKTGAQSLPALVRLFLETKAID